MQRIKDEILDKYVYMGWMDPVCYKLVDMYIFCMTYIDNYVLQAGYILTVTVHEEKTKKTKM